MNLEETSLKRFLKASIALITLLNLFGCSGNQSEQGILRVGTSGDYEPFSFDDGGEGLEGFEIELALNFAASQGMKVQFVRFSWPELMAGLATDRYDVAMSGVTVRADRSLAGRFTIPTTRSGAVVIVPEGFGSSSTERINHEGVRMGVNKGGHLERVARKHFSQATIVTSSENQALPDMLKAGQIDVLITDTLEAPHWLERIQGARALPPFTQDLKAWLLPPDREELAQALDAWLLASEADGILSQLRRKYLPAGNQEKTAEPLAALLAAINERLSLMIGVAESKRVLQKPVEDLQQEARVLDAAVEGVIGEAARLGVIAPDEASIRTFFQAQIEAAKSIQYRILKEAATISNPPDLVQDLRPALGRIGARINRLIFVLRSESELDLDSVKTQCGEALVRHDLSENQISSIAEALVRLLE